MYHSAILMHYVFLSVGDLDYFGRSFVNVNKWVLNIYAIPLIFKKDILKIMNKVFPSIFFVLCSVIHHLVC